VTVTLPPELTERLRVALKKAGTNEIGGILMARHTGEREFVVSNMTIQGGGTFAAFMRQVQHAIDALRGFFEKTSHDYCTHNYLGEWHSHPSFMPMPSSKDEASMREIVTDPEMGANFVVLMIVKLVQHHQIEGSITVFLPDGSSFRGNLAIETGVGV